MIVNKEKNFVSVVVYLHNRKEEILKFWDYIVDEMECNFEKGELIFVNDASEEDVSDIIRECMRRKKCSFMTNVINMSSYHGLEASMLAGVDLAIGDFVYEFDSISLDWPKELFMEVYYASLKGDDIVAATPEGKTEFVTSIFYKIFNCFRVSGNGVKLRRETFRIISRRAINRVQTLGKSIPYRKVMYQNSGLGYKNIAYKRTNTMKKSYQEKEKRKREKLAFDTFLMFTNVVQKVSMALSAMFLIFTLCVGIYVICVYFSANKPIEGWAPIMGFLAAGFSGVFILLTIILKYMSVLLETVFIKKRYLIASIEKINE